MNEEQDFTRFGEVGFNPATKVSRFIDFLREGRLMGTRCTRCGTAYLPPRMDCPRCLNDGAVEWMEADREGELESYTTIHAAPTGFGSRAPYTLGVVRLGNGRLLAPIEGLNEKDIRVGMRLRVDIQERDGRLLYVFRRSDTRE